MEEKKDFDLTRIREWTSAITLPQVKRFLLGTLIICFLVGAVLLIAVSMFLAYIDS